MSRRDFPTSTSTTAPSNQSPGQSRSAGLLLAALLGLVAPYANAQAPSADTTSRSPEPAWRRWNVEARDIVRRNRSDPLWAARTYTMVSVAQHDAVRAAPLTDADTAFVAAASAAAAAHVLAQLYPHEVPRVSARLQDHLQTLSASASLSPAERARALVLGATAAAKVVAARNDDGATTLDVLAPPDRPDVWTSAEHYPPLRTTWGLVRPFLVTDIDAHMAPPPPTNDSAAFRDDLAIVRAARIDAAAEGDIIAKRWADGPGTATPPGHWNRIAVDLIAAQALDEREATHVLALLNMAMFDASVLCWRSKFTYWVLRPPQVDAAIVPSFPMPNFPAYPSGHAAFSGAAAAFLAHRFPETRPQLEAWAEESARSRVVSGIHYPFDAQAGLDQGRGIAALAVARHDRDVPPPVAAVVLPLTEISP